MLGVYAKYISALTSADQKEINSFTFLEGDLVGDIEDVAKDRYRSAQGHIETGGNIELPNIKNNLKGTIRDQDHVRMALGKISALTRYSSICRKSPVLYLRYDSYDKSDNDSLVMLVIFYTRVNGELKIDSMVAFKNEKRWFSLMKRYNPDKPYRKVKKKGHA